VSTYIYATCDECRKVAVVRLVPGPSILKTAWRVCEKCERGAKKHG